MYWHSRLNNIKKGVLIVKLRTKILLASAFMLLLIFSVIEYYQNLQLKSYLGKYYSDIIHHYDEEVYKLQSYLDNPDHINKNLLSTLHGQLLEREIVLFNIPQQLPMKKKYYSYLFRSMKADIAALMGTIDDNIWTDSEEYTRSRME